jgi:hypothetical protein
MIPHHQPSLARPVPGREAAPPIHTHRMPERPNFTPEEIRAIILEIMG